MHGDYSKSAQLGRPTNQETRRMGRTRRPKIVEAVAANLLTGDAEGLATWDEATSRAVAINTKNTQKWGMRWLSLCTLIADTLYRQGTIASPQVTGRNALGIAVLAEYWLDDVDSAVASAVASKRTDIQQHAESRAVTRTDAHSASSEHVSTIVLTCPVCHTALCPDLKRGGWICPESAQSPDDHGGVYRIEPSSSR